MGRRTEYTFFQTRNAYGQQAHEKMLNITNHQGNANQNHKWDFISHLLGCLLSKRQEINADEDVEGRESLYTVGGTVNCYSHYEKQYGGYSRN